MQDSRSSLVTSPPLPFLSPPFSTTGVRLWFSSHTANLNTAEAKKNKNNNPAARTPGQIYSFSHKSCFGPEKFSGLAVRMPESFDYEKNEKRYCIRGKHAAIICVTVVVCSLAVGLGVGLSRSTSSTVKPTTEPTAEPTQPPPPGRGPCQPSSDSTGDWKNFRLPDYVKPVHYDLHLEPDMVHDTYTGTVDIHVEVSKPTRHLWLHIRETFVSTMPKLKVLDSQGKQREVQVKHCFEYKPEQYVVVEAAEELPVSGPGEVYVLSLDFQGWLNGSVVGFYRVVYTEEGVTK